MQYEWYQTYSELLRLRVWLNDHGDTILHYVDLSHYYRNNPASSTIELIFIAYIEEIDIY